MTKKINKKQLKSINKSKHPKHFLKIYAPYLPVFVIVLSGLFVGILPKNNFGISQSKGSNLPIPSVLAYATEMSTGALLANTNAERSANGLAPLTLNSKLNSSATAKANDMVNKDYWSHNSPDGKEPWVFFDAAGYSYQKAGENLAYGFATSSDTVVGWMNSLSHRANILDSQYTEVGFGYINSNNYVNTGQETIVVAHYAKPTASSSAPAPAPSQPAPTTKKSTPKVESETTQQTAPVEQPQIEDTVVENKKEAVSEDRINQPFNTETAKNSDETQQASITLLQKLTKGRAPWSAAGISILSIVVVFLWLTKHAYNLKKMVIDGEHFFMHHPLLDVVVVAFVALAVYLSQSTGVIL